MFGTRFVGAIHGRLLRTVDGGNRRPGDRQLPA
jgi:hypothetical protein